MRSLKALLFSLLLDIEFVCSEVVTILPVVDCGTEEILPNLILGIIFFATFDSVLFCSLSVFSVTPSNFGAAFFHLSTISVIDYIHVRVCSSFMQDTVQKIVDDKKIQFENLFSREKYVS